VAERCGVSALSDRRTEATRGTSEARRQPIDRHDQRPLLPSLNATIANDAQDWQRAAPAPPSPATRQPHGLLPHPHEMAVVVAPRLRFDREADPAGRDHTRVDVSPALPPEPVPDPPSLGLQRCANAP